MSLRSPRRQKDYSISSTPQPPPLIADSDKGFNCSCPPFECLCNKFQVYNGQFSNHQNGESNEMQASNTGNMDYLWTQNHNQNMQFMTGHTNSDNSYSVQPPEQTNYDFIPFTTDLFQPEEIFQLDQPLRNDFTQVPQNNIHLSATSPTTLLDLGSGTIQKGNVKTENFWHNQQKNLENPVLTNEDSNNSSFSSHYNTASEKYIHMNNNINIQTNLNHTDNIACDLDKLQFTNTMVTCQSKDNDNYFTQILDGSCSKNSLSSPENLINYNNEFKHYQCDVNIGTEENIYLKQRQIESDFYLCDKSSQNCNIFQTDPSEITSNNSNNMSNTMSYAQYGICLQNGTESLDLVNYDNVDYNKSYNMHNDSMYHMHHNFSQTYTPVTASN